MEQKNTWLYCRIDSAEDTYGVLESQHQQLKHHAERMGLTVVGASQDLSNGLSMNRPGLQAVKTAANNGDIQTLLVISTSRIGRDSNDVYQFLSELSECGVNAYSLKQGEISLQDLGNSMMGFALSHS